jgi:hypothetical protein
MYPKMIQKTLQKSKSIYASFFIMIIANKKHKIQSGFVTDFKNDTK